MKYIHFPTLVLVLFLKSQFSLGQNNNPCVSQNPIRIVVLGSSTAAGSGVSTSDSAWVNRYRNHLESINLNNQVINLAQGGYTTYKIMRTGFTPPSNRPSPDVNKNITAALAQSPDGIIVNMPSNDVSNGFSYQEQINNLDSIVALANAASVPIWICTTQPKNFNNVTLRQLQSDLKDSIIQLYAPNVLDFWTTLALPDYSIDPFYDSGDGTHVNDAAHAILTNRVIAADLPLALYSPGLSTDFTTVNLSSDNLSDCGDSSTLFSAVFANLGPIDSLAGQMIIELENLTNNTLSYDTLTIPSNTVVCTLDTLWTTVNLYNAGHYKLSSWTTHPNDIHPNNDTIVLTIESLGHPTIYPIHDTLCQAGPAQLSIISNNQDTVFWFDNFNDTAPSAFGNTLTTSHINTTSSYWAEVVRGDLFFKDNIQTTLNSTTNWNGAMLDLVAHENLIIDSFQLKINTLGLQTVDLYTKTGSHLGFETTPSAWTLFGSISVNVTDINAFTTLPLGSLSLTQNDTLGVYFQMNNANSKLSYQSVTSPVNRSTNELATITGSGSSYNFGGNYYPRDVRHAVYYHFGERKSGACSTGKVPVYAFVNANNFSLGNDTIIDIADAITLYVPNGYTNPIWSDGSTSSTFTISGNQLGSGIFQYTLTCTDSLGCQKTDNIIIAIADLVNLKKLENEFNFYPNPTSSQIQFSQIVNTYQIVDTAGKVVQSNSGKTQSINVSDLPEGNYFIEIETNTFKTISLFTKRN